MTIIIMLISLIPMKTNAAVPIDTAKVYSKKVTNGLLIKDGIRIHTYIAVYNANGKEYPAYCMNRTLPGVEEGEQTVNIDSLVSNVMVWRVLINGYPYKSISELGCKTEDEAYLATKQAIYCVLEGTDINKYSAVDSEAGKRTLSALKQILSNAKKSTETKVSSELKINQKDSLWKIDNLDNKYVSQTFNVTANAGFSKYTVNVKGLDIEGAKITDENNQEKKEFKSNENFKVLIPVTNIVNDGNFTIDVSGEVETKPVLYGKSTVSGMQNYAMAGYTYENGTGSKKVYYTKNNTKLVIVKKDNTEKNTLQGVEFELLDEGKNVIYTGLTTDENGKIQIDNLLPGTYYIKETRTLEGYDLYNELIKVELELNETVNVNVINSEEKPDVHVEQKESELSVKESESKTEVKKEKKETTNINVKLPKTGM